jgi:hypothetical protein
MGYWVDGLDPKRAADPHLMMEDCREAHAIVTRELRSTDNRQRIFNLGNYILDRPRDSGHN